MQRTTHNPYAYDEGVAPAENQSFGTNGVQQRTSCSASSIASLDGSDSEVEVGMVIKDQGFVSKVRMKHGRIEEFWARNVIAGAGFHVLVEVQRGYDLGVLVGEPINVRTMAYPPPENCRIIRPATNEEVRFWQGSLTESESLACASVKAILAQSPTLHPIEVVSAELQYDCRLLVVNFQSSAQYLDLKPLTAKLLRKFNMRVMLCRVSTR